MLTTILFWSACATVYLSLGVVIGKIAWKVWYRDTVQGEYRSIFGFDEESRVRSFVPEYKIHVRRRTLAMRVLFPFTSTIGSTTSLDLATGTMTLSQPAFVVLTAVIWPIRIGFTVLMYSLLLALHTLRIVLFCLHWPLEALNQWLKKSRNRSVQLTKKPGMRISTLKNDLVEKDLTMARLDAQRKELIAAIQGLEQEQAAEQGATVYRADNSSESKWRPTSSN